MRITDSYKLIGPNRRSEKTVIEVWLELNANEAAQVAAEAAKLQSAVLEKLLDHGITFESQPLAPGGSGAEQFAAIFCHAAIALQQHAGHRVSFQGTWPGPDPDTAIFAVEYEHGDSGLEAVRLAIALLEEAIPGIRFDQTIDEKPGPFGTELAAYLEAAPGNLLPRFTQDIIDAAERRDIPWVKLDRDPYEGLKGKFRICPNGMLKLGHACYQRVIDGSFPIDAGEALARLAHDPVFALQALASFGAPVPVLNKDGSMEDEVNAAGQMFTAFLGAGEVIGIYRLENDVAVEEISATCHASTNEWLAALGQKIPMPLLCVSLVSEDITRPLQEKSLVVSLDVAPAIDDFLPANGAFPAEAIRRRAADCLVGFLFPPGERARVPVISVTGTNGKSTTSTMIARIMREHGWAVGRATTAGIYLDDEQVEIGDCAGGKGHHQVLEAQNINLAVLETARGGVSGLGVMYDHSDVSVCTNVSPDHLGERGIRTVAQMAELKWFITDRARRAIVLNADDEYSAAMHSRVGQRTAWIVSERATIEELRERFGNDTRYCIACPTDDGECIILHDATGSVKLMPVGDIPATFNGMARFNVSNSLQAIAAGFEMGASIENIREAMSGYVTDFETCPGRMNFFNDLPFSVLFDNAHNDDGHRALREIVDGQEVSGRKILVMTRRGDTSDANIIRMTSVVAGGYDLFLVYDHPKLFGRQPGEVTELLTRGLIENGVPESRIMKIDRDALVESSLGVCQPGDFLVFMNTTPHLYDDWEKIRNFRPSLEAGGSP